MLTVSIVNDRTGTEAAGNYAFEVAVNSKIIHSGRIIGHDRSQSWRSLLLKIARLDDETQTEETIEKELRWPD